MKKEAEGGCFHYQKNEYEEYIVVVRLSNLEDILKELDNDGNSFVSIQKESIVAFLAIKDAKMIIEEKKIHSSFKTPASKIRLLKTSQNVSINREGGWLSAISQSPEPSQDQEEEPPKKTQKTAAVFRSSIVKDIEETFDIRSAVSKSHSKTTYTDVVEHIDVFCKSNYAYYAIKVALKYTAEKTLKRKNDKSPIVFTSFVIKEGTIKFRCLFWGYGNSSGGDRKQAMRNAKLVNSLQEYDYNKGLDIYPHQLFAFFVSRGIYVEHIKEDKLPLYLGKEYPEEGDDGQSSDMNNRWNIKSIRNMVFHDPDSKIAPPSIMLLIDWEIKSNKGLWAEVPDNKSCLSWISFYLLDGYFILSQYVHFRAGTIRGTTKSLAGFHNPTITDRERYMGR